MAEQWEQDHPNTLTELEWDFPGTRLATKHRLGYQK